jgi:hypothetical protein
MTCTAKHLSSRWAPVVAASCMYAVVFGNEQVWAGVPHCLIAVRGIAAVLVAEGHNHSTMGAAQGALACR